MIILLLKMSACYRFQCYIQCKVCYHFNCILTVYGCVITYELNCQRVTAFSVTCSVKCVITSTVYDMGVLSLMSSTVSVLPLSLLRAV